jgi:hypothetical protein
MWVSFDREARKSAISVIEFEYGALFAIHPKGHRNQAYRRGFELQTGYLDR